MNSAPISFFSRSALLFVGIGAVLACWPMLLCGGPLGFFDSQSYLRGAFELLRRISIIAEARAAQPDAAMVGASASEPQSLRSFGYPAFLALSTLGLRSLSLVGAAQAACCLWLVWLLVASRARPPWFWAGMAVIGVLSPVAWVVSCVMPDIFAAVGVLFALTLLGDFDRLDWPSRLWALALGALAAASHYGHLPLVGGVVAVALAIRIWRGRAPWLLGPLVAAPVLVVIALNIMGGLVVNGEFSATPMRLPLLLARSIEDGPARKYLEQACPETDYAFCETFPTIPDSVAEVMWEPGGLADAPPEVVQRIRDEEFVILWEAFQRYPLAQTASLFGNAAKQLLLVGLDNYRPLSTTISDGGVSARIAGVIPARDMWETAQRGVYWLGLAALALALWRSFEDPWSRDAVLLLVAALLLNAAIFGGLSAPAERYGARLAWLPALLALVIAVRRRA